MNKLLILAILVTICLSNTHINIKYRDFLNGKSEFNLDTVRQIYSEYRSENFEKSAYRFGIFTETIKQIREHNAEGHSWTKGVGEFTDMTEEEFKQARLMAPQNCSATNAFTLHEEERANAIPDSYEWNNFGMVSPVKNQGRCGSCWTFSTVGAMESHWNILGKGKNITFSEQQLVDCAGDFDNHGCNGGLPSHAFEYIKYAGGLESDVTYPYQAKDGSCVYRPQVSVGYARYGSYNITQGDEKELAERLYQAGPISVSFQVINGFKDYKSGVYSVNNCGKTTKDVNHAVLATGYGAENGAKFWNVKNSWGPAWGASGYFKIAREANMCAIGQCNSYPLIDKPRMVEEI